MALSAGGSVQAEVRAAASEAWLSLRSRAPCAASRSADLSVTITPSPTSVQVGTSITSTIVVKNKGPSAATSVVAAQRLDADMHAKTFAGGSSGTSRSRSADIGGTTTAGSARSGAGRWSGFSSRRRRCGPARRRQQPPQSDRARGDPKRANNSSVASASVRGEPAPLVFSGNGSAARMSRFRSMGHLWPQGATPARTSSASSSSRPRIPSERSCSARLGVTAGDDLEQEMKPGSDKLTGENASGPSAAPLGSRPRPTPRRLAGDDPGPGLEGHRHPGASHLAANGDRHLPR